MASAPNRVNPDLTQFAIKGSNTTVQNVGDGTFRVSMPTGGGTFMRMQISPAGSGQLLEYRCEIKTPSDAADNGIVFGEVRSGQAFYPSTSDWQTIGSAQDFKSTLDDDRVNFDNSTSPVDVLVRNFRVWDPAEGSDPGQAVEAIVSPRRRRSSFAGAVL